MLSRFQVQVLVQTVGDSRCFLSMTSDSYNDKFAFDIFFHRPSFFFFPSSGSKVTILCLEGVEKFLRKVEYFFLRFELLFHVGQSHFYVIWRSSGIEIQEYKLCPPI